MPITPRCIGRSARSRIEALHGLAEGLKAEARLEITAAGLPDIMAAIASSLETSGTAVIRPH
ncbi:MAG: hypothetical protein WAP03_29650 [Methylorubrum rhodinum]|uniref:hypothetical protein n=1 Tax=Methylorubrum rhodinum TaxID=29428 RepID=UPI003BAFF92A